MTGNLIIHAVNCRQVVGTIKVINCVTRLHLKEIGLYYNNYVFLLPVENKNTTIRYLVFISWFHQTVFIWINLLIQCKLRKFHQIKKNTDYILFLNYPIWKTNKYNSWYFISTADPFHYLQLYFKVPKKVLPNQIPTLRTWTQSSFWSQILAPPRQTDEHTDRKSARRLSAG